jgi:diaminohydroxyphosphoribosylaminopyrimidine deaminase/5-amino-6-(5-phosphoribosylamino)uracil reductase
LSAILNDETYMRLALQLAGQTVGQTGTNPVVGCVVVKDGRIVGLGAHLKQGEAHAEVHAIRMAGKEAAGSTVYVTLEPCSHFGRTPPCCDLLIGAQVKRVVIACLDPNPLVAGSGAQKLREQGIIVETGLLGEEAQRLNEAFFKYVSTGLPFVTLKTASTLDGKIAARTGDSRWITNEQSREYVHTLRHRHAAVMIGIGTLLADDPRLTTRLSVPGLHPVRVVIDSRLTIPEQAAILQDHAAPVIVVTTERADPAKAFRLQQLGADVIRAGEGERVDLPLALRKLGERRIGSILLEGGGTLNGAMLEAGLIDKIVLFFAPKLAGGPGERGSFVFSGIDRMSDAYRLEQVELHRFGDDFCITGYPRYPKLEERKGD